MMNFDLAGLKSWLCYSLLFLFLSKPLEAGNFVSDISVFRFFRNEPAVTVAELQYEKLMKVYVNKIKLAFSETEDQRSLAILTQFLPEFSTKTDAIKKALQTQLKQLNPREKELLFNRIRKRSQTEELIAVLFDERITSRTAANPKLKILMEQLHAKSLEVQQAGNAFIAAD